MQGIFWQHSLNITRFVYKQKNLYKQHNSFCNSFAAMATRFTLFCNDGLRAILNVRFEASLMCQLKLQGNQRTKLVKSMKYHTFQLTFFCLTKSCASIVIIFLFDLNKFEEYRKILENDIVMIIILIDWHRLQKI